MLDKYALLNTNDFDLTREYHAQIDLGLEPAPRRHRARSIHTIANCFNHPDFQLYYFTYSDAVTLHIAEGNGHHWMALPVMIADQSISLLGHSGRLDSHGTPEPLALPARAQSLGFCLKQPALQRYLTTYLGDDLSDPFEFLPGFDLERAAHRAIGQMVVMLAEEDARGSAVLQDAHRLENFLDSVTGMMLHYCPHSHTERMRKGNPAPAPRDVKRVMDYIHSLSDQPITLVELIDIAGVPGRTLNQHFRTHTGLSPMAYLHRTRLRNTRRALLRAKMGDNVTQIAIACGMTHLGRFSARYKIEFGELPSETLQRRRLV